MGLDGVGRTVIIPQVDGVQPVPPKVAEYMVKGYSEPQAYERAASDDNFSGDRLQ